MADIGDYCGTWRIVKCQAVAIGGDSAGIEGTEFTLDESGDVTWNIPENTEPMPFFNCETYEIYLNNPHYLRFFGTFVGDVIEFRVDQSKEDTLHLAYEGWCILQCERVLSPNSKHYLPFSFLCALEEGYFSDLSIYANGAKEFKVHKTVLKLVNPCIDWDVSPSPLDNLPEDVLFAILHYLYSECLPADLKEDTARNCLTVTSSLPGFDAFRDLCELFLKNSALKQQIITLVMEMHACAQRIIDYFSGKTANQDSPSSTVPNGSMPNGSMPNGTADTDNLLEPAKLCYVIRQALRESAVAGAKMLILCDLFSKRKNELSREERHEIIKYCKSRLPIFMTQLYSLLIEIKTSFGNLTVNKRMEIASYFVPEIEDTLDSMFEFVTETKTALEQIISISSNSSDKNCPTFVEKWKKGNVGEALGRSLKNALHMRELMKLRNIHERVTASFMNLMHKKESFSDMNTMNKNRSVAKNLEQLIDEIPLFMLRTEELKSALDEKLTWKEWKYLFKLGTSKVAWVLSRFVCHRATLHNMITHVCELVNREQFTRSLVQLGLLDPPVTSEATSSSNSQSQAWNKSSSAQSPTLSPVTFSQFCLVESLCHPPISTDSKLAKHAVSLLKSGLETDMSFEIAQDPCGSEASQSDSHIGTQCAHKEFATIKAHCVVIASRCDWFRKALLSGMRESINKQIIIHDTSPQLFQIFLEYLYGGQVDTGQLMTDQLASLMQLSDRYEVDCLKQISEDALVKHIDEDSALFLLSIADQFNASALRTSALEFIALNKDIVKSEVFYDLPEDLQSEVEGMIRWVELRNSQRNEDLSGLLGTVRNCTELLGPDSPSSMSSSLLDIEELTSAMNLSGKEGEPASDSSSLEELSLTHDSAQLEACVAQLRDIVGDNVAREDLVRVSLAADYDVNRALNFIFS